MRLHSKILDEPLFKAGLVTIITASARSSKDLRVLRQMIGHPAGALPSGRHLRAL